MAKRTYKASCHCGAVRYEVDVDLSEGTMRCNCSICTKARAWFRPVPAKDFRLLSGEQMLADYHWLPPGRSESNLHYRFCKRCGVRAFAQGHWEALGGEFFAIAIATLDNADPDELARSIKYLDGRHDRFDQKPGDTRLL
jgi:hypothetical protein